jgi:hypothetical protein
VFRLLLKYSGTSQCYHNKTPGTSGQVSWCLKKGGEGYIFENIAEYILTCDCLYLYTENICYLNKSRGSGSCPEKRDHRMWQQDARYVLGSRALAQSWVNRSCVMDEATLPAPESFQ